MVLIPKQLGPYRLREEIGAANGVLVYCVTDSRTLQDRLLYVLDPLHESDPACVQRFLAGVDAAAQLRHKHILTIHEYGQLGQHAYAATEPLVASALTYTLHQGQPLLSASQVIAIVEQVAVALDFAAVHGCLHLALAPEELWLTGDGRIQVSGFGLSGVLATNQERVLSPSAPAYPPAEHTPDGSVLPELSPYTAPEQLLRDQPVDHRTDVYRLCAIAYTLLVGSSPFPARDPAQLQDQIIRQPPTPPESIRPDLPASLVAVLKFGLAKDPDARYTSAGEFAHRLCQAQRGGQEAQPTAFAIQPAPIHHFLTPTPPTRKRHRVIVAASLVSALLLTCAVIAAKSFDRASTAQRAPALLALATPTQPADLIPPAANQFAAAKGISSPVAVVQATPLASATQQVGGGVSQPGAVAVAQATPAASTTAAQQSQPTATVAQPPTATAAAPTPTFSPTAAPVAATPTAEAIKVSRPLEGAILATIAEQQALAFVSSVHQLGTAISAVAENMPAATATPTLPPPSSPAVADVTATPPSRPTVADVTATAPSPPVVAEVSVEAETPASPPVAATELVTSEEQTALYLPLVVQSIYIEGDVNQDANLRAGPSITYPVMGVAFKGQRFVLVGCNADCTWYQLTTGEWIAAFLVSNVSDPLQTLPQTAPDASGG